MLRPTSHSSSAKDADSRSHAGKGTRRSSLGALHTAPVLRGVFSSRPGEPRYLAAVLLLFFAEPIAQTSPWAACWTVPCILFASIVIAWGAESAQFFVAQGFALAVLAWMQTLPEFAVEAVLAWRQQMHLMLAGLTGALRLLTGLAWPMIYLTSAIVHRKRTGRPLRRIQLKPDHSVEVVGVVVPLLYAIVIWWKATLAIPDAVVLVIIYLAYLALLTKLPPEREEGIEDLEGISRRIVLARPPVRKTAIAVCFLAGGVIIYFTAEPFLGSLVALAISLGIPSFYVIQWLAPVVSEFPEMLSTFYFARQEEKAGMALMNIVSSNINQWTLLVSVLPIVYSISRHSISTIALDAGQRRELLLTIGQSLIGAVFLINMKFEWWEAITMLALFIAQFLLPLAWGEASRVWITDAFLFWAAASIVRMAARRSKPAALDCFLQTWRMHVRG